MSAPRQRCPPPPPPRSGSYRHTFTLTLTLKLTFTITLTLTLTLTLPLTLTLTLTLALTLTLTLALTATRSVPPPQVSAAANIHNLVRVFPDGMHTAYASPLISRIEPPGGPVLGGTVITVHGAGFDAGGVGDAASCSFVGALPDGVVRVRQCAGLG